MRPRARPDTARLLAGDRAELARAITLVESSRADDRSAARDLLDAVMPHTGQAVRVGITGVPGVGKSTLIDALGMNLIGQGHRVAVLAVDPSSTRTGGAILGDKTRMARLATDPAASSTGWAASGRFGSGSRSRFLPLWPPSWPGRCPCSRPRSLADSARSG